MPAVQTDLKSPVAGDTNKWPKLKLNHGQVSRWSETKAGMLWAVPHFEDIHLAMMVDRDGEQAWFTDRIDTAATDDKFLYINPKWYFKLTLDERLFVNSHEIEHAMYGHAGMNHMLAKIGHINYEDGTSLPYDGDLMNCAEDYVINDQLITAKIGKMPEGGLHWPTLITGDMSVQDAYRLLYKEKKKGGGNSGSEKRTTKNGQQQGPGSGKPHSQTLKPGQGRGVEPNKAVSERQQAEWDVAVQAAMESAKMRGQLPENLERLFRKRLTPKADWRDLFQLAVNKKIGNDRYTWDRLEQQLAYRRIGAPGRTSFGCDLVVVVRDSSGSIDDRTCAVFGAETRGILEQARPRRVILIDCDAEVHRYEEIEDLSELETPAHDKVLGGGGTSFKPPFERLKAEGEEPDAVIYLTDCMGDYGKKPDYPVIWGVTSKPEELTLYGHDYTPPFGEIVFVPKQAEQGNSEGDL
jgi:predicted metal-dependent peptidase